MYSYQPVDQATHVSKVAVAVRTRKIRVYHFALVVVDLEELDNLEELLAQWVLGEWSSPEVVVWHLGREERP